jgi:hypothetical protein
MLWESARPKHTVRRQCKDRGKNNCNIFRHSPCHLPHGGEGRRGSGFFVAGLVAPYSSLPRSGCTAKPRVHGEGVPQDGACRRILLYNAFGVTDEW